MENRRRESKMFALILLIVLTLVFVAILFELTQRDLKPEIITLVGGFAGTVLAMIGMIVSNEFGSTKGSQAKDQLLAAQLTPTRPPNGPDTGGVSGHPPEAVSAK